jgi:hypothetical protein
MAGGERMSQFVQHNTTKHRQNKNDGADRCRRTGSGPCRKSDQSWQNEEGPVDLDADASQFTDFPRTSHLFHLSEGCVAQRIAAYYWKIRSLKTNLARKIRPQSIVGRPSLLRNLLARTAGIVGFIDRCNLRAKLKSPETNRSATTRRRNVQNLARLTSTGQETTATRLSGRAASRSL